jgi:hypothetical protein
MTAEIEQRMGAVCRGYDKPEGFPDPGKNIRGYLRGPPAHTRYIRSSTIFFHLSYIFPPILKQQLK